MKCKAISMAQQQYMKELREILNIKKIQSPHKINKNEVRER